MTIETWLGISLFINFCYGVEGLNKNYKEFKEKNKKVD